MRRSTLNFIVDGLSLIVMLGLAWTGVVMRFLLPPGTGGRGGGLRLTLWGWGRHDWGNIHFWMAIAIAALLLIHVVLHWTWLYRMARQTAGEDGGGSGRSGRGIAWGVALLALVAAGLAGTAVFGPRWVVSARPGGSHALAGHFNPDRPFERGRGSGADREPAVTPPSSSEPARRPDRGGHENALIRGSMTLSEVAAVSGVPEEALRAELRLGDEVPSNERLGRLRRMYGFDIADVRDAVQRRLGAGGSSPSSGCETP
ncbi:MAG: hypothetical protein AMXMBFR83_05860 [Phycisphaerae bacterium]